MTSTSDLSVLTWFLPIIDKDARIHYRRPPNHRLRQSRQRSRGQQLHQRHPRLEFPIQPIPNLDRDERVEPVRHDGLGRRDVVEGNHEDGSELVAQGFVDGSDRGGEGGRLAELGRRRRGIRGFGRG